MKLSTDVLRLIPQSEAKEIFCDYAEVALDANLTEGVLKDIPVIGTIVKVGGAVVSVRDRLFIQKLERFFRALDDIPNEKRKEFVATRLEDDATRRDVGEKIILLIDRQDDFEKAELIGFIFKRYIEGDISRDDFDLLAHAITNAYLGDLAHLEVHERGLQLGDDPLGAALFALNLAEIKVHVDGATWDGKPKAKIEYVLSHLGKQLAAIMDEFANRARFQRRA